MRRRSSGVARRAARSLLVLGGTSEIAQATTIRLARAGAKTIVLAGRDTAAIEPFANGLRDIGVETVEATVFDADSTAGHRVFVDQMVARFGAFDLALLAFGAFDLALLAFGVLGRDEQRRGDEAAMQVLKSNLLGAVSVAFPLVEQMKAAGNGTLVVLSSVAAERPRADNYLYAASKAGLDAFFQGMADSLVRQPVRILVVRPGFVHTKMTRGLRPRPFAVGPERVADDIMRGLESRATTIWSPPALRYMMAILRHLPRPIFRRLAG